MGFDLQSESPNNFANSPCQSLVASQSRNRSNAENIKTYGGARWAVLSGIWKRVPTSPTAFAGVPGLELPEDSVIGGRVQRWNRLSLKGCLLAGHALGGIGGSGVYRP